MTVNKILFISDKMSLGATGYVFYTGWLKGYLKNNISPGM